MLQLVARIRTSLMLTQASNPSGCTVQVLGIDDDSVGSADLHSCVTEEKATDGCFSGDVSRDVKRFASARGSTFGVNRKGGSMPIANERLDLKVLATNYQVL
jgi:hypothetical protein